MNITILDEPKVTYTQKITTLVFKYGSHTYELSYIEDTNRGYFKLYNELGEEINEGLLYKQLLKTNVYNLIKSQPQTINLLKF